MLKKIIKGIGTFLKWIVLISLALVFLAFLVVFVESAIETGEKSIAIFIILIVIALVLLLYPVFYFKGKKFRTIKSGIAEYTNDCNELNRHIEELRSTYVDIKKTDYGEATYTNISKAKYKKGKLANARYAPNVYDCSSTVCDNARKQPFKYICKYFNIPENEKSLSQFEEILNNFAAAEEGKNLSKRKRDELLNSIAHNVPWLIRKMFSKRLEKELGFEEFQFNELFYPVFSFRYVSAGGRSGNQFSITMDIPMLERFVTYLSERVKFKASVAGQRRLMTPALRRSIITRDHETCKLCQNSTSIEPNLLLEVDHIIPVSKGGLTTEDNLQTLCWKCNRHKGAKIIA